MSSKHTDFYHLFKHVKQHVIDELKAAVKAHGGSYSWEDDIDCPIVAANPDTCEPKPLDVCINKISLDANDNLVFEATEKEWGYEIDYLCVDGIFIEHIGFIIEYMKDTPEVSDVSIPFHE